MYVCTFVRVCVYACMRVYVYACICVLCSLSREAMLDDIQLPFQSRRFRNKELRGDISLFEASLLGESRAVAYGPQLVVLR